MGENRGKQFESTVKNAFLKVPDVSVDRLLDPMSGYSGVRNICDFIVYKEPHQIYVECKCLYGNTLNFKGAITKNQWDGLLEKSKIPGVIAGVLVWFIDYEVTYFVPIQDLQALKNDGNKSLHINHLSHEVITHVLLPGKKKRVFFDYDALTFLNDLFLVCK